MKIRTIAFSIILILAMKPCAIFSQDEAPDYSVKFYNQVSFSKSATTFQDTNSVTLNRDENKYWDFFHAVPAFMVRNDNDHYHEFALTRFVFTRDENKMTALDTNAVNSIIAGSIATYINIEIQYEYIFPLFSSIDKKISPSIGLGTAPYFIRNATVPFITTSFPFTSNTIGFRTFLTPRIMWMPGKSFFADLNFPLALTDFYYTRIRLINPNIPLLQQSVTNIGFETFSSRISFRLGGGWRF